MVPAQCAGVVFTVDPISGDATQMVVNAATGLGVGVVSGVVEPEQYRLSKAPEIQVVDTRHHPAATAPLLTSEVATGLGTQLRRIETLCGAPQDVEWAWDGKQCWIVQSRPITTLGQLGGQSATADSPDVWTNANLKDVLPGLISPLSWSTIGMQLDTAIRAQYGRLGYTWPLERHSIRRFWGRLYFNMSLLQQAGYDVFGSPPSESVENLGARRGFYPKNPPACNVCVGYTISGFLFAFSSACANSSPPALPNSTRSHSGRTSVSHILIEPPSLKGPVGSRIEQRFAHAPRSHRRLKRLPLFTVVIGRSSDALMKDALPSGDVW